MTLEKNQDIEVVASLLLNLELERTTERVNLVCQSLRHVFVHGELEEGGEILRKRLVTVDVMTHRP